MRIAARITGFFSVINQPINRPTRMDAPTDTPAIHTVTHRPCNRRWEYARLGSISAPLIIEPPLQPLPKMEIGSRITR